MAGENVRDYGQYGDGECQIFWDNVDSGDG